MPYVLEIGVQPSLQPVWKYAYNLAYNRFGNLRTTLKFLTLSNTFTALSEIFLTYTEIS
jgi:hypothetical protein